jgi:hypothetical protein|tara:strand:- start:47232 stop:47516 length:285 start_codon:yes stop_codon:yes gene_type:complete
MAAHDQPVPVRADNLRRLVAADPIRRNAPGVTIASQPFDHRANANAEPKRRLATGLPFILNCRNNTLTKIHRIGSRHGYWPPFPASMVNHYSQI